MPQKPDEATAHQLQQKLGEGTYSAMSALGLFDLYHTKWFQGSLALLCVSLFICSVDRIPRTLKLVNLQDPIPAGGDPTRLRINRKIKSDKDPAKAVGRILSLLKSKGLDAEHATKDGVEFLFINRGAYARFGVYCVHASIILVLVGAIIGNISGFDGRMQIVEGKNSNEFYRQGKNADWQPIGFDVACEKFAFSLDPDTGMPGNYQSDLTLSDSGKEVGKVQLRVNHPYYYKGIGLYQSSYQLEDVEAAVVKAFSPEGKEIAETVVKAGQKAVELPGIGKISITNAKSNPRTQMISEVSFALETANSVSAQVTLRVGQNSTPSSGGSYKVSFIAKKMADASEVMRFELAQGEEKEIEPGVKVKMVEFSPEAVVHDKKDASARIEVLEGEDSTSRMIFKAFPNFDKMNAHGKYFFSIDNFTKSDSVVKYEGPSFTLVSADGLYSTILDVNRDPGVPVVYLGCIIMVIALYVTFFWSHRKIWIRVDPGKISIGGSTNRNETIFESDFSKLAEEIESEIKSGTSGGNGE